MLKTPVLLAILPLVAATVFACADDNTPESVARELTDIAASHDCAALTSLTAPDVRSKVECDARLWSLVDEVAPMVNEQVDAGVTFTLDPDDDSVAYLPFVCRGAELAPCYFEVHKIDGTWYLYDLG
ncbi:MAG TPA: hypothetical protein VGM39_07620 [Kofleriaceae bacterium]|jgi:hypothetical protein